MWVIALLATSFTTHTNVPPALCHTTPAAAAPLAQAEEKAPPGLLSRIATRLRFRRSEDEGSLRAGTKERSMEATGAALLWQKLGAFRGGRPPSPSDEQADTSETPPRHLQDLREHTTTRSHPVIPASLSFPPVCEHSSLSRSRSLLSRPHLFTAARRVRCARCRRRCRCLGVRWGACMFTRSPVNRRRLCHCGGAAGGAGCRHSPQSPLLAGTR